MIFHRKALLAATFPMVLAVAACGGGSAPVADGAPMHPPYLLAAVAAAPLPSAVLGRPSPRRFFSAGLMPTTAPLIPTCKSATSL
nr:hypothetical protein [Leptolyngbya sp. BC1307]